MKLIHKTTIIFITLSIFLSSVLFMAAKLIVVTGFQDLENKKILENNERVINAINHELEILSKKVLDWAYWNDTYDFMIDRNESYLINNVYPISTFANIDVNLCLFINETGELIKGFNTRIDQPKEIPLPEEILEMVEKKDIIFNHKNKDDKSIGLLLIDKRPLLFASYPVLTSEQEGPPRGTLAFGRFLDSSKVSNIMQKTNSSILLTMIDNSNVEAIKNSYNNENTIIKLNIDSIYSSTLINDLKNSPIIQCQVSAHRHIYKKGISVLNYFILSLIIFSIIFIGIVIFIIYLFVLKRIYQIQNKLIEIKDSGDLSQSIEISGSDELSQLAKNINNMNSNILILQNEIIKKTQETGMSQITSDILQNAGILLNKSMLSSKRVKVFIMNDDFNDLLRSVDMLLANRADPVKFFTEGKGELLLEYLNKISSNFSDHKQNAELYQKALERGLDELQELFETYRPYTQSQKISKVFNLEEAIDEAINSQYYGLNEEIEVIKKCNYFGDIKSNKKLIVQVLSNLLKNAAERKRDGNEYKIEIISEKLENGKIRLLVKDNSIGIPVEERILTFNYRYSTKDPTRSTGLFNSTNYAVELNALLYLDENSSNTVVLELPIEASQIN